MGEEEQEDRIRQLEEELKADLQKLSSSWDGGKDIIGLIYRPNEDGGGMEESDVDFLKFILETTSIRYPVVLLHGPGGAFVPAVLLPRLLKKTVEHYKVYVPGICCSALCYTIFQARQLILGHKAQLSQIDPKFPYQGELLRAIRHMKSSADPELKRLSREIFDMAQEQVGILSAPPSIFEYRIMGEGEFLHTQTIIDLFMNKEEHEDTLTIRELRSMEMNVVEDDDLGRQEIADHLINLAQDLMDANDSRVIIFSSKPIILPESGQEGIYFCPLR